MDMGAVLAKVDELIEKLKKFEDESIITKLEGNIEEEIDMKLDEVNKVNRIIAFVAIPHDAKDNIERQVTLQAIDRNGQTLNVVISPTTTNVSIPISAGSQSSSSSDSSSSSSEESEETKSSSRTSSRNDSSDSSSETSQSSSSISNEDSSSSSRNQ